MRVLSLIAAVGLFFSSVAFAHSMIKEVSISSGDKFLEAPEMFSITFSHKALLAGIVIETTSGEAIDIDFTRQKEMSTSYAVEMPTLSTGNYLLTWKAIARDGHIMTDTIDFSVE